MQANTANKTNWFLGKHANAVFVIADNNSNRLEYLNRVGFHSRFMKSDYEVDKLLNSGLLPTQIIPIVKTAAEQKVRDVVSQLNKNNTEYDVVIGFHTIAVMEDAVIPKPTTPEEALSILKKLSGHSHNIFTGVALLNASGNCVTFYVSTEVKFADISEEIFQKYIELGFWIDKYAGYDIEQQGATFVEKLNGSFSNVIGIPFFELVEKLQKFLTDYEKETSSPAANQESGQQFGAKTQDETTSTIYQSGTFTPTQNGDSTFSNGKHFGRGNTATSGFSDSRINSIAESVASSYEHDIAGQQVNGTVPSSAVPQNTGTYGAQSEFHPARNNDTNAGNYGRGGTATRRFVRPANSCASPSTRGQSNQLSSTQNGGFSNRGSYDHGGAGTSGISGSRVNSFAESAIPSGENAFAAQQVNGTVPSSSVSPGTYGAQLHPTRNNNTFSNAGNFGQGGAPTSATSQHTGTYGAQSEFHPTQSNDTFSNAENYGRGGTATRRFVRPANSCASPSTRSQSNRLPSTQNGSSTFSARDNFGHGGAGTPGFSGSRVDSFAEPTVPSGEHSIVGQQPNQNSVLSFLNRGGTATRRFTLPANSSTRGQSNQLPSTQNGGFSNRGNFGHGGAGTSGISGSRINSYAESAGPSEERATTGRQPAHFSTIVDAKQTSADEQNVPVTTQQAEPVTSNQDNVSSSNDVPMYRGRFYNRPVSALPKYASDLRSTPPKPAYPTVINDEYVSTYYRSTGMPGNSDYKRLGLQPPPKTTVVTNPSFDHSDSPDWA